jgi:triosephosphate isomerase
MPSSFSIAYEPVWAIGTGNTPTPDEINDIHKFIKDVVQSLSKNSTVPNVLYGGSVNDANAESFFKKDNVDGALIGGASLQGESFANIVNIFNGKTI